MRYFVISSALALAFGLTPSATFAAAGNGPAASQPASGLDARIQAAKGSMMSDPATALAGARSVIADARKSPGKESTIIQATGQWLEGEALVRLNRSDEAGPIIEQAIQSIERLQPGSKLHADLLKSKAAIAGVSGDVQQALTILQRVHRIYAKLGEARSEAIVYQNIGSIYSEARDYRRVLYYYDLANETFADDPNLALSSHNNRGNAFKEMGKFEAAIAEYRKALAMARKLESPLLEARILTNLASAQYMKGNLAVADQRAVSGLRIATGDASEWRPYLWGVRAQIALKRGDLKTAEAFVRRTFTGVDLAKTTTLYRDFHETARVIYEATGRDDLALTHLKAFKRLDDEARSLAASTESALMTARFDRTNQELRITRLKAERAAGEVKLARSDQKLRNVTATSLIAGAAALAILLAISIAFAAARRARREIAKVNARLSHTANHDGLTGLPNRGHLRELLATALDKAADDKHGCALFLIDLDRFKAVNDELGHQAGDALLGLAAERLRLLVADKGNSGRLGGDEFAAFLPFAHLKDEPVSFAGEIVAALAEPFEIDGRKITIGATVGMSAFPLDAQTIDQLTRCADLALYHAKQAGRGRSAKYASYMQIEIDERRQLEVDLASAIGNGEMTIAYQPIVKADSAEVVAYEALLRWEHPLRGTIPPDIFIPIAEETKLITEIGRWVLRTACAEAANWPVHVRLAVNLSAIQIEGSDLTAHVVHALAAHELTTDRLELEVTESIFLRRSAQTDATMARFKSLGVTLVLDDFGTGYSSLSYLQRASFSTIKIDRAFVQGAAEGKAESLSIVKAIVALADGLGMETTAEGVESAEQMELMQELGCTQLQGFYFGRPEASQRDGTKAPDADIAILTPPRRARRRSA